MSVEIPLTKGKVAIVDNCDAHLIRWKWCFEEEAFSAYKKENKNLEKI